MRRGALVLGLFAVALAFALAWPGGGAAQKGPCQTGDVMVDIRSTSPSNDYVPDPVNVPVGGTVCWTNTEMFNTHTATANNGSFDSGSLNTNESYRATFNADATIAYHCNTIGHGGMGGTVRVGTGGAGGGGGGQPGGGTGGGGSTGPGADAPPRLSTVRIFPARVCTKRSSSCPRPGARLRFSLNEAARVRGTLETVGPRSARVVRRFSFRGRRGVNRVRLPVRRLRRGRYRASLRAVDAGGNRSRLVRARFRIVR
jgi:plastocyanin